MVRSRALQRGRGAVAQHPEVRAEALYYEPYVRKVHDPNARQKGVEATALQTRGSWRGEERSRLATASHYSMSNTDQTWRAEFPPHEPAGQERQPPSPLSSPPKRWRGNHGAQCRESQSALAHCGGRGGVRGASDRMDTVSTLGSP